MTRTVTEFHFICRRGLNVVPLPDGQFETGSWKVARKHAQPGTHVALHENRNEPSYLQGEVVSVEEAKDRPGSLVFRVRASPTPLEWPPNSGAGEKGYRWSGDALEPTGSAKGLMYDCDVKALFMVNGQKELRWETRPVSSLGSGAQRGIRCMHCHGEVRVHKQRVPHGPADYVRHLHRQDAVNCRGGHYFCGVHQMSKMPVK